MAAPTSVEDYLAALPQESRAALEKLRKRIKAAAPGGERDDQLPDADLQGAWSIHRVPRRVQGSLQSLSREQGGNAGARRRAGALFLGEGNAPLHPRQAHSLCARDEDREDADRGDRTA